MGEEYIIKKTLKPKKIWFDSPRLALIEQLVAKKKFEMKRSYFKINSTKHLNLFYLYQLNLLAPNAGVISKLVKWYA